MRHTRLFVVLGIAALQLYPAFAAQNKGKKLTAEAEEFLSQARYLISKEDRKELLSLPEEQQADFIEQFWKKRDPDPATPTNEFKEEYFRRIGLANEMFTGEPQPGWLTDRGRIVILYGEPKRREKKAPPPGRTGPCLETWYYDDSPVVFSDKSCSGTFTLETRNLDAISSRNTAVAARSRSLREPRSLPFDFEIHILKRPIQGNRLECIVKLDMPYSDIWFEAQGGGFGTSFGVEIELTDSQKVVRWTFKNSYPVKLTAAELKEKQKEMFEMVIPMTLVEHIEELRAGRCRLSVIMQNETSKERIRKVAEFSF